MGMERRGNGYYYYKKVREGRRVFSQYVGNGAGIAEIFSMMIEMDAEQKELERFTKQREREKAERFEAELSEIENAFSNLITACFLVNGYSQTSSREWRKKRNGNR